MDWTEVLAVEEENRRARLAAEILGSEAYPSTGKKAQAFVEQGGGCRATFFNYRRRLGDGAAAEILASDVYQSTMDKVRAFVQRGGGCRATFFNYRRRLN